VQLTWESQRARGCVIAPDVGDVAPLGATLVRPTVDTTYELTCNLAKAHVFVSVRPNVRITMFTATPAQVIADSAVTLAWDTVSAEACTLEPGLGEVDPSGAKSVFPSQNTTYTLTCKGVGPRAVATTAVTVAPATTLDQPTQVAVVAHDGSLQVSWVQGAGSGTISFAEAPGITRANFDSLPGRVLFRKAVSPFTINGLVNGTRYYLRVSATSAALESPLSDEVTGTPVGGGSASDPYFGEQWHLFSALGEDINVASVWAADVKGEGVKVAVVDEGVDLAHEDLSANIATQQSYDYLGNAPVRLAEHGTSVAGLLSARDLNGLGVRGVAPRANLRSFNLLQDLTSAHEYDAMTRQKDVVAISNNAWGDAFDSTGLLSGADPQWLRGVTEGATTGRGGKGTVYFWASGNGADPAGPVDDANFDSQANSRFVLTVGGVGANGRRPVYAEGGACVLIVAPTQGNDRLALVTTDLTGIAGYNTGNDPSEHANPNYSKAMNGTSGATPVAAGVGALVLQVRPELSYRDVRRVLALSARKCEPSSPGWATNGAGLHVNHEYGFGVVDATAAVALARTITPVGPELKWLGVPVTPALAIPDNAAGVSSSTLVSNSGIGHIEVIEAEVTIAHAHSGELEVTLSNGATTDVLHPAHRCLDPETNSTQCADIAGYVFTTVRHLDEPADGTWTLRVRDTKSGLTGTLTSWTLRIYGRN